MCKKSYIGEYDEDDRVAFETAKASHGRVTFESMWRLLSEVFGVRDKVE